jgi:hypothetical protein
MHCERHVVGILSLRDGKAHNTSLLDLATMFELAPNTDSVLTTATWIFRSETEIDLPASDVWQILNDDNAWAIWHPEVTNIVWTGEAPHKKGSERTVVVKDTLFMILLAGPLKIHEVFDVWEEGKKFGFYFKATNRPNLLTFTSGREEFKVEAINDNKCKFTRTIAVEPGFLTRYGLGFIAYPHFKKIFTKKCPDSLVKAVTEGKLPLMRN